MEGKDFAKSKRRTTQRHTPRRGGFAGGSKHESALSRLDTNQDRYDEPDATGSGEPVPRSQGADLGALLSADYTEFRHRGSLIEEADALPTPSGLDTAVLDLNIDLQALAVSLAHLPVDSVLDIDPCYCTDFAAAAPDRYAISTDSKKMSASEASRTSSQNAADDQQDVPDNSTVTQYKFPKGQVAKDTLGKARQDAGTAQKDSSSQKHANISTAGPDSASQRPAELNAAHRDTSQKQKDSSNAEGGSSDRMSSGKHASAAAQTPPPAASSADKHDDELDAILNATDVDTIKPASTVIEQPAKQDEESLEDWLNSL